MESLLNAFRSLGPGRILALFIGIAAVIAISSVVINRAQTPSLALLYGGLDAQESSRITGYLETQNIPNEVRGDGAIYVPADRVGELRLQVAGQGLVGGSTTGYELFDNQSTFGTTNFVSNLNAKRALEGELARTIGTIPAVSGARVHIVLPKQNLFSREQVIPSAAIALNLGSRTLTPEQVQSIAQLTATAVPNLTTANVTIIDQRGTLLFDGKNQSDTASTAGALRRSVEKSYEDSVSGMLERVVGAGNAVVRVTADLNLDKLTEQSELYDPAQQVVRSEQTVESTNTAADGGGNGGVTGVAGNTPGGPAAGGAGGGTNSNEARNETTTNYEISKTVRSLSRQGGEVRKLSVAVLVAGKAVAAPAAAEGAAADAAAAPAYTPLSDDEKTRIRTLVETAIGFDAARGDKVEIVDMPFTAAAEPPAIAEPFMTKAQIMSFAQYGLIVIALIVVAMMVVKPALNTLNTALASGGAGGLLPSMAPGMGPMGGGHAAPPMPGEPEENSMIDIRSVQGRVRESAVKKVNEIIDQYPEESLGVVRNWMGGSPTDNG